MLKKTCLLTLSLMLTVFYSCNLKKGRVKTEFYPNGNLMSTVQMKNGKENGTKITYYEDGSIEELQHFINGKMTKGYCTFDTNGCVVTVGYYKSGMLQNNSVLFDSTGNVEYLGTYDNDTDRAGFNFRDPHIKILNPSRSVIKTVFTYSGPFVSIESNSDTITLGDTYKAKIMVNFPMKGYRADIFIKNKETEKFDIIDTGGVATYTVTPSIVGKHSDEISIYEVNRIEALTPSNLYPKPVQTYSTFIVIKYYVKAK